MKNEKSHIQLQGYQPCVSAQTESGVKSNSKMS